MFFYNLGGYFPQLMEPVFLVTGDSQKDFSFLSKWFPLALIRVVKVN